LSDYPERYPLLATIERYPGPSDAWNNRHQVEKEIERNRTFVKLRENTHSKRTPQDKKTALIRNDNWAAECLSIRSSRHRWFSTKRVTVGKRKVRNIWAEIALRLSTVWLLWRLPFNHPKTH